MVAHSGITKPATDPRTPLFSVHRSVTGIVAADDEIAALHELGGHRPPRGEGVHRDVRVPPDVLRHRLVLSYDALADGVPADHIVHRVLQTVPLPQVAARPQSGAPVAAGFRQPPRGNNQQ